MDYTDVFCEHIADPYFVPVTGTLALAQKIVRRLISPRGSHPTDPNYGTDIRGWINSDAQTSDQYVMLSLIRAEVLKETDVVEVDASVSFSRDSGLFTVFLRCSTELELFTVKVTVTEDEEEEATVSVRNVRQYPITVTDTAAVALARNVNRKGITLQNLSATHAVYYCWNSASAIESCLVVGANAEKVWSENDVPVHSLFLLTAPGETASVRLEERY